MEHATNIAYPRLTANGTLDYETLMAHELSHHWWGDLATCETHLDMWINEGMATYSEHIFLEYTYDYDTYLNEVKTNHADVLQFAHVEENGYRAVSGIPHQYTYGKHVYNKGASVAHNMRAYMGDSLFFYGLKEVMNSYQYKSINSTQFRDELTNKTGINMNDFFNDWVFNPGFSHFSIDSTKSIVNGSNYDVTLFIKQKLRGATQFHNNTPIVVSFYDANFNRFEKQIIVSGQFTNITLQVPFNPVFVVLNERNKLNQARTDNQLLVKNNMSNTPLPLSKFNITINNVTDSALLQIEHHWVSPDSFQSNPNNYKLSTSRYWSVQGIIPNNFSATGRVFYDGRSSAGYLDADLLTYTEDSIMLFYREGPHQNWIEYPYYTKNTIGASTAAYGFFNIDSLLLGEYTFANGDRFVGVKNNVDEDNTFIYPNPTKHNITIKTSTNDTKTVFVFNVKGDLLGEYNFTKNIVLNASKWSKGNYLISIINHKNKQVSTKKIVKN